MGRHRAASVIVILADTAAYREKLTRAALPELVSLIQDTGNPAGSMDAAAAVAKLAASPALLPGIEQALSGLVISRLVSSLQVRTMPPQRGLGQVAAMDLHCGSVSEHLHHVQLGPKALHGASSCPLSPSFLLHLSRGRCGISSGAVRGESRALQR